MQQAAAAGDESRRLREENERLRDELKFLREEVWVWCVSWWGGEGGGGGGRKGAGVGAQVTGEQLLHRKARLPGPGARLSVQPDAGSAMS